MTPIFVDSFHFLALLNPRDSAHGAAHRFEGAGRKLVTSWFVLIEVADALSRQPFRAAFSTLLAAIEDRRDVEIVPTDPQLLRRATMLYGSRPDKDWSLTDCTSFVIMQERNLNEALTGDRHFEQAGFRILPGS